jgi:hypothetical protein
MVIPMPRMTEIAIMADSGTAVLVLSLLEELEEVSGEAT